MGASVRLKDKFFTDPRVKLLGKLVGCDDYSAEGRMARVYLHCTQESTYTVGTLMLDAIGGCVGFGAHLVVCGLGEPEKDGLIRIKGTEGEIEWYQRVVQGAQAGGLERAARAKRTRTGTFAGPSPAPIQPLASLSSSPSPAPHQPISSAITITTTLNNTHEGHAADEPPPGFREAVDLYFRLYQKAAGCKPAFGKKDGAQLKALLKKHGQEQVARRLEHLFGPRCPAWLREGRDLGTLVANWNKLVPPVAHGEEPAFDPEAEKERRRRDDEELAKRVAEGRI